MARFDPTPPVNATYGAPMGRPSRFNLDTDAGPLYLRRVPINSGGYDRGGAYWGLGAPLFCAMDQHGATRYLRARNRDAAKRDLCADYDGVRFYR